MPGKKKYIYIYILIFSPWKIEAKCYYFSVGETSEDEMGEEEDRDLMGVNLVKLRQSISIRNTLLHREKRKLVKKVKAKITREIPKGII